MNNLSKRIITSIILIFILSISLFYNKYIWLFTLIFVSLVLFIEFNNLVNKIWKKEKIIISNFNIFSLLFLLILIYVSYKLYSNPPMGLVFIILICIFSDTGGYLIGNLIGGKKLTKISPNKTISGAVGSFICSLIPIIYFFYYQSNYSMYYSFEFKYLFLICIIFLLISLVCQLGDLFISYFKRRSRLKDTGKILPGHGGLLDRIDGIIFAVPFGILLANMI